MKSALLLTTALCVSLFSFGASPAFADEETEALKKEIKALEARINQLEKRENAHKKETATAISSSPAAGTTTHVSKNVEQRLAIVERKQELAEDDSKAKAEVTPKFDFKPSKGLTITSPDKQYALRLTSYFQADNRTFLDSGATGTTNTFLLRSARPIIEAKLTDYFDSRFQMDFGKGSTTLLDAYGDFHPIPGSNLVNLRAGEFKVPVGIERWQSESDVLFVERGQTTNLVPYRDIGVMLHGQLVPDQLEYQLALVNGAADLQANTGDTDNNKDLAGRVFVHPLTWSGIQALEGIGLGVAGTYGVHQGSTAAPGLTTGYVTFGQRTFFAYAPGSYANGAQWRLNPQATYYNGPLGVIAEYVTNDQELRNGANVKRISNNAWEGIASYVITGEDASFDGVTPAHNFDPRTGNWGAFEVLGRASQLNVAREAFASGIFGNKALYSRSALETTLGGTWYFSRAVKLNLDLSRTTFDAAGGALNHPDEKAIVSRAQFRF